MFTTWIAGGRIFGLTPSSLELTADGQQCWLCRLGWRWLAFSRPLGKPLLAYWWRWLRARLGVAWFTTTPLVYPTARLASTHEANCDMALWDHTNAQFASSRHLFVCLSRSSHYRGLPTLCRRSLVILAVPLSYLDDDDDKTNKKNKRMKTVIERHRSRLCHALLAPSPAYTIAAPNTVAAQIAAPVKPIHCGSPPTPNPSSPPSLLRAP